MDHPEQTVILVDGFIAFTLAIVLLFVGKSCTLNSPLLRQYSIPEPVIGGFACATTGNISLERRTPAVT